MSEYVIVTDSAGDLNQEMVERAGVEVLPLSFRIRGEALEDYPDKRSMSPKEFYQLLREGENSTTNAVNMSQYVELLTPILESGRDVLILSFSSGLSATCQSSMMAAQELREQFPERKIYVVDTLCASLGQGMLVWHAGMKRQEGMDIDTLRNWCEDNKMKLCHWFTVDDLMYLKRGGRVSAATAVVGTMLQIKPVLHVDNEGHLINMAKARGRKASLDALIQKVVDTAIDPADQVMFISHSDCQEDAEYVANGIQEKCGTREIQISSIGPVIGSHTGPGCVALFFFGQPR